MPDPNPATSAPARETVLTKLVLINSQSSFVMTGDDAFPASRNDVLPRFLNAGWRIVSVHTAANTTGYVLLQKP